MVVFGRVAFIFIVVAIAVAGAAVVAALAQMVRDLCQHVRTGENHVIGL